MVILPLGCLYVSIMISFQTASYDMISKKYLPRQFGKFVKCVFHNNYINKNNNLLKQVVYFIKEVNPSLAKSLLNYNRSFAKLG